MVWMEEITRDGNQVTISDLFHLISLQSNHLSLHLSVSLQSNHLSLSLSGFLQSNHLSLPLSGFLQSNHTLSVCLQPVE